MLAPPPARPAPRIEVGRVDDPAEHEAERVAAQVMRMPSRRAPGGGPDVAPASVGHVLSSPGKPLDPTARSYFEGRLGTDLGHVRIHDDARAADSARAVGADAYALGDHLAFAEGRYAPRSPQGMRLLAHELVHVAQRRSGKLRRYQAGEAGHGSIEEEALHAAGFHGDMTHGEIGAVYLGNWMRDWSQIGDPHNPWVLRVLNILSMGEFNRPVSAAQVGGYLASEHLDRPDGGSSPETERLPPGEAASARAALSPEQLSFFELERSQAFKDAVKKRAKSDELPPYIEVGRARARAELRAAAQGRRGDPDTMQRLGAALHAIEDYYAHSNFVDSCVYLLVQEGRVPKSSPVYQGIMRRARRFGYDPLQRLPKGQRPQIVTGSVRKNGNLQVSVLEALRSEVQSGSLRRAAMLGAIRLGYARGGALGRSAGAAVGRYAVGGVAAAGGAVLGGAAGAVSGLVQGFRRGHGIGALFGALRGAVTGLFGGAASGARAGWRGGSAVGERAGGSVGQLAGSAIGAAAGTGLAAVIELISLAIGAARVLAASRIERAIDRDIARETDRAIAVDKAAKDGLPNHSQLAKDDYEHPLFQVSRSLAVYADTEIGRAMIHAWEAPGDARRVEEAVHLVDKFVCHPMHEAWWRTPLLKAIKP